MRKRDRPVEVGAAEPDAMAREDPHLARLDEEGGEIRGPTADVDDQPGAAAFPECSAGERRGLGLGQKRHVLEAGSEVAAPQVRLGL